MEEKKEETIENLLTTALQNAGYKMRDEECVVKEEVLSFCSRESNYSFSSLDQETLRQKRETTYFLADETKGILRYIALDPINPERIDDLKQLSSFGGFRLFYGTQEVDEEKRFFVGIYADSAKLPYFLASAQNLDSPCDYLESSSMLDSWTTLDLPKALIGVDLAAVSLREAIPLIAQAYVQQLRQWDSEGRLQFWVGYTAFLRGMDKHVDYDAVIGQQIIVAEAKQLADNLDREWCRNTGRTPPPEPEYN